MCRRRTRRSSSQMHWETLERGRAARPAASEDARRPRLLSALPRAGDGLRRAAEGGLTMDAAAFEALARAAARERRRSRPRPTSAPSPRASACTAARDSGRRRLRRNPRRRRASALRHRGLHQRIRRRRPMVRRLVRHHGQSQRRRGDGRPAARGRRRDLGRRRAGGGGNSRRLASRSRRLWRSDRRRPHQPAQSCQAHLAVAVLGRAGRAAVDQLRRRAGRCA